MNNVFKDGIFLTDGGLETTLIYNHGIPLNHFAAFELMTHEAGKEALRSYYLPYLHLAKKYKVGVVLETPTWRASPDWGFKLGYSADEIKSINKSAVTFVRNLGKEILSDETPVVVSGNIGPRGDGYKIDAAMSAEEAKAYHFDQVQVFALGDADLVTAMTINYIEEAIGIVQAAKIFQIPVVISFTVETDGRLPDGSTLQEAITITDEKTAGYPLHYMINCAHPEHFIAALKTDQSWKFRIKGIRANASTKSHAELDEATAIDRGDICRLASGYTEVCNLLGDVKVIGGCCGTDHQHIDEIFATLSRNPVL